MTNLFNLYNIATIDSNYFLAYIPTVVVSNYWKQQAEKDIGQVSNNPHLIAARIIADVQATGRQVTYQDINAVLVNQGYLITAEELEQLKDIPYTKYSFVTPYSIIKTLKLIYPSITKSIGHWGVYIWQNTISGMDYVESTQTMSLRLKHYWSVHNKENLRKILMDIKTIGLDRFVLLIYDLPNELRELRLLLGLEQYYILTINPQNNMLYVAGGPPGGMRTAERNREKNSLKTYMYLNDLLIYVFKARGSGPTGMCTLLNCSNAPINLALNTGSLWLDTFKLTSAPIDYHDFQANLKSLSEVQTLVIQARISKTKRLMRENQLKRHTQNTIPLCYFLLVKCKDLYLIIIIWSFKVSVKEFSSVVRITAFKAVDEGSIPSTLVLTIYKGCDTLVLFILKGGLV